MSKFIFPILKISVNGHCVCMNKSRRFVERHNETSDQKSSNKKENGENEIEYSEDSTSNEKDF